MTQVTKDRHRAQPLPSAGRRRKPSRPERTGRQMSDGHTVTRCSRGAEPGRGGRAWHQQKRANARALVPSWELVPCRRPPRLAQ